MTTIDQCPVCDSATYHEFLKCKDFTVSGEIFTLVKCQQCSFVYTNPRPNDERLGDYYKSETYISHTDTKKGLISKLYHFVRSYTIRGKITLISKFFSNGRILDYGCGTGAFLKACQESGWKAVGIEPDPGARSIAMLSGVKVEPRIDLLSRVDLQDKFDVISLWHVLEHVTDLSGTLKFFKENLDPKGKLIIAVPNYESFDAKNYGEFWAAYDVPRHLYHFSKVTMSDLMHRFGFELTEIKPMKFDGFYVSMLSEKYKNGKINYLKAFTVGWMSNLKGRGRTQNYSSLIYIFKHRA